MIDFELGEEWGRSERPRIPARFQGRGYPATVRKESSGGFVANDNNRRSRRAPRGPASNDNLPRQRAPYRPAKGLAPKNPFGKKPKISLPRPFIGFDDAKLGRWLRLGGLPKMMVQGLAQSYFDRRASEVAALQLAWNTAGTTSYCISYCNPSFNIASNTYWGLGHAIPCGGGTGCLAGQAIVPTEGPFYGEIGFWREYPIGPNATRAEHAASFRWAGPRIKTKAEAIARFVQPAVKYALAPNSNPFPWADPLTDPLSIPWPTPIPFPAIPARRRTDTQRIGDESASGPAPSLRPRAQPNARPAPAELGKREEKRQGGRAANALFGFISGLFHGATELGDFVDAVHEALPKKLQTKDKSLVGKMQAVIDNWRAVDVDQMIKNIVANEVEDRVIGAFMGQLDKAGFGVSLSGQPYMKRKRKNRYGRN